MANSNKYRPTVPLQTDLTHAIHNAKHVGVLFTKRFPAGAGGTVKSRQTSSIIRSKRPITLAKIKE